MGFPKLSRVPLTSGFLDTVGVLEDGTLSLEAKEEAPSIKASNATSAPICFRPSTKPSLKSVPLTRLSKPVRAVLLLSP